MISDPDINDEHFFNVIVNADPPVGQGCLTGFFYPPSSPNYLPIQLDENTGELFFCEPVDFESGPTTFEFRVRIQDSGTLDGVTVGLRYVDFDNFIVNIVDFNDNPPSFDADAYDFNLGENMAARSLIGSISASDSDGGLNALLVFSIINGSTILDCNDEVPFYVEKTGDERAAIRNCRPLDYEETMVYVFTVRVCDSAVVPLCDDTLVTVTVLDRNDNPPEFVPAVYTAIINETDSSDMMSSVVTVRVVDADSPPNSISTFSILTPSSPFGLRAATSNSAVIYVENTDAIDFESGTTVYVIEVQALNSPADVGDSDQSANTTVTVMIVDVNDNAPVIMPPLMFDTRENQPQGTQVGCVNARDADSGARADLVYYIDSVDNVGTCAPGAGDLFVINSTSGCISTCGPLDYEGVVSHSFVVIVCDSSAPPMCSNRTFIVNIIDLNDNAPIYTNDPFIVNINENSEIGTSVVMISSTDIDSPANSEITYSFQNTSGPFEIRAATGEVVYNGVDELDFEGPTRTYVIHVQGTNPPFFADDVTQRSDVALVVNVVDRNDHRPVFPQPTDRVSIREHTPVSTEIYTLSTTDGDTVPNSAVRYEIVEAGSPFAIQGSVVTVINSDAIDYDPPASVRDYILTIRAINEPAAADDVMQISNFTLTIDVTDINDNAPECIGRNTFILPEDADVSLSLVRAMANDIDDGFNGNAGLQFFVTGEDAGSGSGFGSGDPFCTEDLPFRIDPDSGYISICVPLDYETTNAYDVNITVCDMGNPRLCTVCPIMFSIMDVNDNPPIILQPLEFNVSEELPVGSEIGCVNVTDADSGQNALLDFVLESECSSALPFTINETTGCVFICAPLDFETTTMYSFSVTVRDNGSPSLNSTDVITVSVINENDHAPIITSPNFAEVEEELDNELVITVTAVDIDAPPFNTFEFELVNDAGGSFVIDQLTGQVRTAFHLDRETQEVYNITVRVFDGLNENVQNIVIVLIDINDNPPEYLGDPTYSFMENMLFDLVLVFRDNDTGNNSVLTYDVSDSRFAIDSNGILRNLVELDRDPLTGGSPTIMLLITVTDGGDMPFQMSVVVSIELIDVNDNAPTPLRPFMADVVDGSPEGTEVITISAEDADAGTNAEIVFVLGEPSDNFAINFTTGVVTLTRDIFLTSDAAESMSLSVNMSDRGIPTQVTSRTYVIFVVSARPLFTETSYSFTAIENEFRAVIGVVMAEDRDINPLNDDFVFAIEMVSPYNPGFRIISDLTNGTLLSPPNYFDYEDTTYFNISITVSRINMTEVIDDRAYVIVNLVDSNDNVPRLSPLNISAELREDARNGDIVATAIAIDFDGGPGGQLTYNLSGNGAENFAFDSAGNLYVSVDGAIDFESDASYIFIYQACDGGGPQLCSEPGYIFIQVINVDDLPPVFEPSTYEMMISEGFGTNRLVLYVNFSDPDTPLTDITLTLQPPQVHFQIILLSGVGALMTTDVPLDRETLGLHTFSIVATDTAGATASASVVLVLLDVNDQSPFVDTGDVVVTYDEGGVPVSPASSLNIVDGDDISQFPLTRVSVSLHPSPTSAQTYPSPGGTCDHANYSLLFDSNVHNLCGLEGCIYLLRADEIVIPLEGSHIGGILELPRAQDIARNPVVLLDGDQFEEFTVTIWVRFTSAGSGNIFEVQSGSVNVFGVSVRTDGSLQVFVNPTQTTTTELLNTGPMGTHDGQWHQLALIKEGRNLTMLFDCEIAGQSVIPSSVDTAFTQGEFTSASFFIGNRLSNGFYAEFYFCSSVASQSHVCCTLNCGESLDVVSPTDDVEVTVDLRTRSVEFVYVGTDNNASLIQLQEAVQKIVYINVLDEPHPLDRGLFFIVYDLVGPSDIQTVVVLRPVLINDQRPLIDLNGTAQPGINFFTRFDETSAGTPIIGGNTILYDRDSGFWPMNRVVVELVGTILQQESLIVIPALTPLTISVLNGGARIEIFSSDPQIEYFPSEFIFALSLIRYVDRTDEPTEFTRQISITVYDQGATFVNDPLSITFVTITPSNDMPVLDLNTANSATPNVSVVYEERTGRVLLLQGMTQSIIDPDSSRALGATFTFTRRPNGEQEVLQVDSSALPAAAASTLLYNFDLAAGVLTLEGNYDFNTWLGILRAVEYTNNELNPSELDMHEIGVVIRDDGGDQSLPAYIQITLALYNNPPQIFLGGANMMDYSTTFTEDGDCVPVTSPDIALLDLDSNGIQLVRVSLFGITEGRQNEFLLILGSDPVMNAFNLGGSIIFVLQQNTPADYEAVLRRVVYCNLADEPDETSMRQVTFQATDTGLTTASGTTLGSSISEVSRTTIQITRINDRPELSFESLNNISIRGVPTPIINPDTIVVDDSDNQFFNQLLIYISNPQDGPSNEIIEFARQLPESTVSVGPIPANGQIQYQVTFRDTGADIDRVIETISNIRYNNRADSITVDPPRVICLTIMDFELASELSCVTVTISPPNNFDPVFSPTSPSSVTFLETDDPIDVAFLRATDGDTGLEGMVSYSIYQVISFRFGTIAFFTTADGIFLINSDGDITAPNGLDAEEYTRHEITVVAADMGNPVRSAQLVLRVDVSDMNDNAPSFTGTPYVAGSQREELSPPRFVFLVTAVDLDVASSNNRIQRYGLENYQNFFTIDSSGAIQSIVALDADTQSEYLLNVSAVDSGSPPQTGYTTVLFTLLDFNDNAAEINQLAPAIHVIGGPPNSIGPAIRIEDEDLNPPAISQLSVTLTPNAMDSSRTYDQCLEQCQETRIREANLLPPAIDLLALATFQQDQPQANGFRQTQVGAAGCTAWELTRGATIVNDGYGRIPRGDLPADFASGDFSLSLVLAQTSEGYIILVPDQTDPTLPSTDVERPFAIWLRRRDFRFYYTFNNRIIRATYALRAGVDIIDEFFTPGDLNPQTRHYTIIVKSSPPTVEVYIDCQFLLMVELNGAVQSPPDNIDVFIGQSRPNPTNGGRLAGNISNFFYHPTAITPAQLLNFCSCGFEAINLPPLPSSIMATTEEETRLVLQPTSGLIPVNDALSVLRGITYENTFPSPADTNRQLSFTVREETGIEGSTMGSIQLVTSDDNLPVVDLTGPGLAGIDYDTSFTEDASPVFVAPDVRISRDVENSVTPTFDRVIVQLVNPIDANETLSATSTSGYVTVDISDDGHTVLITGPGIEPDFVAVLQTVAYENTNDNPTVNPARVISFTVVDTGNRMNNPTSNTRVALTAVNDPPLVSMASVLGDLIDTVQFVEGSSGVLVAPNVLVMDVDDTELLSATITLQSPNLATDRLLFDLSTTAISGRYDSVTGVLALTGRASLADYQLVLSSIMFVSTDSPILDSNGNPESDVTRVVTVVVSDGNLDSEMAQVTVQFMPINDPPTILLNSTLIQFRDGDMEILIAPDAEITDVDTRILASMTVELEGTLDDHQLSDGGRTSRVLVFDSNTTAGFTNILRGITYINFAAEPTLVNRMINVEVCDSSTSCTEVTIIVEIIDTNDNPPMFSDSNFTLPVTEDVPVGFIVGSVTVFDSDRMTPTLTFSMDSSNPFDLVSEGTTVHVVTTELLDFETTDSYFFMVVASDGFNQGFTNITVNVLDVNEQPLIVLEPPSPSIVVGPGSESPLILVDILISDPDFGDSVDSARLVLRNVPDGSNETLGWNEIFGYSFVEVDDDGYWLTRENSSIPLAEALQSINYIAGLQVADLTEIRHVAITVYDQDGLSSDEATVNVSLASIPEFTAEVYSTSLMEGVVHRDFLQIEADVENGGDVIEYAIDVGSGVTVDRSTGLLSLARPLDHEVERFLTFSVYAIDALPPARTGTATVNITVIDVNDVRPVISDVSNITISTGVADNPFPTITITDPDTTGLILRTVVSVRGESPLVRSPFSGRVCVDEYNVINKMTEVCGLPTGTFIDLAGSISSLENVVIMTDSSSNRVLTNTPDSGYSVISADFSSFEGLITELTFTVWLAPTTSGYIAYFGTQDSTERYFAVYYDNTNNRIIVTLKRSGLSGLSAQVRVNFQLQSSLDDGSFHFIMIQYVERDLVCVVDGVPMNSLAVVYKEQPFIGEVYGEATRYTVTTTTVLVYYSNREEFTDHSCNQ